LAITKEHKNELITQYVEWVDSSQALVVTEYKGLSVKDLDDLRAKLRVVGGEFHIIKNTLGKLALEQAQLPVEEGIFEGSTAISFAFKDAPAMVKTLMEFAEAKEFIKVKGGYLEKVPISPEEVKALAELPSLPVLRATILGTLIAPASKLTRLLAEPGRQVAAVIKAYAESNAAADAA
jgi:large subunit ribosomal protein L10